MSAASMRPLTGENPHMYEISIPVDAGQCYAKLLRKAAKLVKQLDPDGCWVSGMYWSEGRDRMAMTITVSHPRPKCVTCRHREPHNRGGIGVCANPGCGCDGPCT